jgi:hypothetical protein
VEFYAVTGLVIAAPIALLLWARRHRRDGEEGTDPAANRDIAGRGGVPGQTSTDTWTIGGP